MMSAASIGPSGIAEVFYAQQRLAQADLDMFGAVAVPISALTEPDPPLAARVAFVRGGTFDIVHEDEPGVRAIIFLERNQFGDVVDIIAWQLPDRLASWLNVAAVIGLSEILQPRLDWPLPVFRSPLGWLAADRRGVVIVSMRRACRALEDVTLLAEDHDHGHQLRFELTKAIPAPKVVVRKQGLRA